MAIYEFITIERTDGPFEIPGTIVEVCDDQPHSKQRFTVLARIDGTDVVEEETEDSGSPVDYTSIDGVGETVATRLKAAGYVTEDDVRNADADDMADQVKGLGPGIANNIKDYVE